MKIVSWNVNGLRAVHRKGNFKELFALDADIYCLQEIKAEENQFPTEMLSVPGYETFINSSRIKKGYSGVALYTKESPETVQQGMGIERFDGEGRVLTAHYKNFTLCNIYFPNGGMGPERLQFKMDFYDAFLSYIEEIRKTQPNIIFCGDVNTAHEPIDLARPKENEHTTGFLPEERAWIDELIAHDYIDVHRHLYPEKTECYTWWNMRTRARERNVGWRIDYFFVTHALASKIQQSTIHHTIQGSDHCPLSIDISL